MVVFDPITGTPVQSDKVYEDGGVISPFLAGAKVEFEFSASAIIINALTSDAGQISYDRLVYPGAYKYSNDNSISGFLEYAAQGTYYPLGGNEFIAVNRPLSKGQFTGGVGLQGAIADANSNQPQSSLYYFDSLASAQNIDQRKAEGYPADSNKAPLATLGLSTFYQDGWWNNLFDSNLI